MAATPALRRRLIVQALLPLAVTALWIAALLWQISQLVDTGRWVDHTDQVISEIQRLEASVYRHVAAVRGFVVSRDAALLRAYQSRSDVDRAFDAIETLTADNPPQVERARAAEAAYEVWRRVADAAVRPGSGAELVRDGDSIEHDLLRQFDTMRAVEERLRLERTNRAAAVRRRTLLVTSIAGAMLAIFLAVSAARALNNLAGDYEGTQQALLAETAKLASAQRQLRKDADLLEERVKERTRELERANAQLEAFGYSVSHDLRAPLRGVQGLAQALVEDYGDRLDATGRAYATRVVDEAALMDVLIQDLLAYSRVSRADLEIGWVSLADIVAVARQNVEHDAAAKHADVTIAPELPTVRGNRAVLIQVFTNLLSNAIKFGGDRPSVLVWAERMESCARVWVADRGIGIEPEHHERIFRVFERLHGSEAYPGTGIGLAIVRQVVERLGGRVGVESALGQGSRFWVELPMTEAV